jgi:hypothetical protein
VPGPVLRSADHRGRGPDQDRPPGAQLLHPLRRPPLPAGQGVHLPDPQASRGEGRGRRPAAPALRAGLPGRGQRALRAGPPPGPPGGRPRSIELPEGPLHCRESLGLPVLRTQLLSRQQVLELVAELEPDALTFQKRIQDNGRVL